MFLISVQGWGRILEVCTSGYFHQFNFSWERWWKLHYLFIFSGVSNTIGARVRGLDVQSHQLRAAEFQPAKLPGGAAKGEQQLEVHCKIPYAPLEKYTLKHWSFCRSIRKRQNWTWPSPSSRSWNSQCPANLDLEQLQRWNLNKWLEPEVVAMPSQKIESPSIWRASLCHPESQGCRQVGPIFCPDPTASPANLPWLLKPARDWNKW